MMVRKRWGLGLALLMAAALAGLLLFSLQDPPKFPRTQLADGRVVELAGITHGMHHSLQKGTEGLAGMVRAFLPLNMRKMFGPNFGGGFGFGGEDLALWTMCYDPVTDTYVPGAFSRAVLLDQHGCEFPSGGMGASSDGPYQVQVLSFSAFPRREPKIRCRLYDKANKVLGEFIFHNPKIAQYPTWEAEPLPTAATNGPLEVRLEGFTNPYTPKYKVFFEGMENENWEAKDALFEDATGNRSHVLCREESAWKWKASFYRKPTAEFSEDEIWRIQTTAPPPGKILRIDKSGEAAGFPMEALFIAGPGRYQFSNEVLVASAPWTAGMAQEMSSSSTSNPLTGPIVLVTRAVGETSLVLSYSGVPADSKLLVAVRSGDKTLASSDNHGGMARFRFVSMPLPTNGEPLEVEFILHKGHPMEFTISPDVIGKENSPR